MKKRTGILICLLILLVLPGCYDRVEPKDLAIVSSVLYDKKEDGTYQVVTEFLELTALSRGSLGGESKNHIEISDGETTRIALANSAKTIEMRIYAGHNHVRFFSEDFAQNEDAMITTMDFLLRDRLTDETSLMVVVKGSQPEAIYAADFALSDTMGMYIHNKSNWQPGIIGKEVFVTALDFAKDYLADGKQPVAGVIEVAQNRDPSGASGQASSSDAKAAPKSTEILYEGLAAFKGIQLVGYMDGAEAQAYNYVTNNLKSAFIAIASRNNQTGVQVLGSSCKTKTTVENNVVTLDLNLTMDLVIDMEGKSAQITQIPVQGAIEQAFDLQVQQQILGAILKAQTEFKSDIFGFGGYVHSQHPEQWKNLKQNWDDTFAQAIIHVTVDSTIIQLGEMEDSVLWEEEH